MKMIPTNSSKYDIFFHMQMIKGQLKNVIVRKIALTITYDLDHFNPSPYHPQL